MNLIQNYKEFLTNHAPYMVHGMVHGKCQMNAKVQNPKYIFGTMG